MTNPKNPEWRTGAFFNGRRFIVYPLCEYCEDFIWMHVARRCMYTPFKYKSGRMGVAINTGSLQSAIRPIPVANNRTMRAAKWKPHYGYHNKIIIDREDEIYWAHYLIETGGLQV